MTCSTTKARNKQILHTVHDREVDGDEHQNRFLCDDLEGPQQCAMGYTFDGPIGALVRCEEILVQFRILFA